MLFTMQLHNQFESLDAACNAIKAYVLDEGELFKTVVSNKKQYIIKCKDTACSFRIRTTKSSKEIVSITISALVLATKTIFILRSN
jgi:hypothetical protein